MSLLDLLLLVAGAALVGVSVGMLVQYAHRAWLWRRYHRLCAEADALRAELARLQALRDRRVA